MKKIQSLFKRDYEGTRLVYDEIVEGSEWVVNGEGVATEKFDGTSCLIQGGQLFKRYDAKKGKTLPVGFIAAQEPDAITGHYPGWLPVDIHNNADKWHISGLDKYLAEHNTIEDGTYELVGEKIQRNPYQLTGHELWKHGSKVLENAPTDFDGLKQYLTEHEIEGVVWHHADGRMVKIKRSDFGLEWNKQ